MICRKHFQNTRQPDIRIEEEQINNSTIHYSQWSLQIRQIIWRLRFYQVLSAQAIELHVTWSEVGAEGGQNERNSTTPCLPSVRLLLPINWWIGQNKPSDNGNTTSRNMQLYLSNPLVHLKVASEKKSKWVMQISRKSTILTLHGNPHDRRD